MRTKTLLPIVLTGLLAACAAPPPHGRPSLAGRATPKSPAEAQHPMYTPLPLPPRETAQRTVEDVLEDFGPYAVNQLKPYFEQAKVAYPPSEVTLLALKAEKKLELWARSDRDYHFIRDYDILAASGTAGPKLRQGDRQVPEGIYRVIGLNPNSNYHLSMKLNYPNDFDLFYAEEEGRDEPGSDIFIHGSDVSIGCLAMGDAAIDELFVLAAQVGMENVKVVIAPYDPRLRPLEPVTDETPAWTEELYGLIEKEVQALAEPVNVSASGRILPPRPLSVPAR